jgi:hypothetical protein
VLAKLPGWVIDDDASVMEEVAEWRDLSKAELWRLAVLCSRDAIWAVRASADPERVLAYEDPLPESTLEALARLRREAGWGRGDR